MLTASSGGSPGAREGHRRTTSSSFSTRMLAGVVWLPSRRAWKLRRKSSCQVAISLGLVAFRANARWVGVLIPRSAATSCSSSGWSAQPDAKLVEAPFARPEQGHLPAKNGGRHPQGHESYGHHGARRADPP